MTILIIIIAIFTLCLQHSATVVAASSDLQFALCPDFLATSPPHQPPPPFPNTNLSDQPQPLPLPIAQSVGILPRSNLFATLDLSRRNGFIQRHEGTSDFGCAIRLESCAECALRVEWEAPSRHFTEFQRQSLSNCDNRQAEDADMLLATSDDHPPCFGMHIIEERADLPPLLSPSANANMVNPRTIFDPNFVYRRVSLWDDPEGVNFNSSGNTLLVAVFMRNIGQDAQLQRFLLQKLFPLKIFTYNADQQLRLWEMEELSGNESSSSSSVKGVIGFLQSPRFPAAYSRAIRRNWTLIVDKGRIWMAFDDFHLHYLSELKVVDSDGGTELFNSRAPEHRRPTRLISRGNRLSVAFTSNEFTQLIGFRARYGLVTDEEEQEMLELQHPRNCDEQLEGFGGRITLDGQRHLLHEWVDCVWLIGHLSFPSSSPNPPSPTSFDSLYLRIEEFHLRGRDVRLELRDGANSAGKLLLSLTDEQTAKQLVQKQPEEGFILSAEGVQQAPTAFYLRLTGRLENFIGLSVLYAHFYRWPTALCPGGPDEFHCDNGRCIRAVLRCDGYDHCGDSSDELCHFHADEKGDDELALPSGVLTVAFGILTLFLLVLLLVLFASRTARRHLVAPPLGRLGRRRGRVPEGTMSRQSCGQRHQTQQRGAVAAGTSATQQQQNSGEANARRNSSSLATQLDFAVLNNLLGSAANAANLGPSIQTLGERRFFVLPADQAPISVIEAPPSYADAMKHPKVSSRGSRHLVHPVDGGSAVPPSYVEGQPSVNEESGRSSSTLQQNAVLRLSPSELCHIVEENAVDQRPSSVGLPSSPSNSPFQSARSVPNSDQALDDRSEKSEAVREEQTSRETDQTAQETGRDGEENAMNPQGITASAPSSSRSTIAGNDQQQSKDERIEGRRGRAKGMERRRRSTVAGSEAEWRTNGTK